MRAEIAGLQNELGVTTIYVTHDQVEAMTMGDRVSVMRKGEIQQVAPPQELYERPVNLFVGGFIGSPAMNLVEATIERSNGRLAVQVGEHPLSLDDDTLARRPALEAYVGRKVVVGVRPENLEDSALEPDTPEDQRMRGVVVLREPLGSEIVAHFTVAAPPALTEDVRELARDVGQESAVQTAAAEGANETVMVGRFGPRSRVRNGDVVDVAVETGALHFFDLETGLGIYSQGGGQATKPATQSNDGEGAHV
jgi:multiple sugar transport system ATP-binding protein